MSEKISMVRRLRLEANALGEFQAYASRDYGKMLLDAADEIERLRKERDEARKEAESWQDDALRMMRDRNTAERERDEARREICSTVVFPSSPKQYAERRGWDCFKEHGK